MKHMKVFYCILLPFTIVFALEPARANLEPEAKLRGDEKLPSAKIIPYFGDQQGPGDIIGTTAYDYQTNGCFGQRIMVDDNKQAHINWMWQDYPNQTMRYCAWNARYIDGSYFGETQASDSWSGYVKLDVTRDANPDSQRTVICYHFNPGSGFYSWIDIDAGNLTGSWPNDPKSPEINDYIWPTIAVASNNNILMATGDYNANMQHLLLTTDQGNTWTSIADIDSCARLTHFLRASHIPGSQKVVMVWTQWITDTIAAGTIDQNVWFMMSLDNGVTWGSPGAGADECMDEDYYTAYPFVINDSIYITYIEDKDAGAVPYGEGALTENPVHCWVFHRNLITGIAEDGLRTPQYATPVLKIHPNPFSGQTKIKFQAPNSKNQVTMSIYDVTGHLVKDFSLSTAYYLLPTTIQWSGRDQLDRLVPAGVYFIRLESEDYTLIRKVIKLK